MEIKLKTPRTPNFVEDENGNWHPVALMKEEDIELIIEMMREDLKKKLKGDWTMADKDWKFYRLMRLITEEYDKVRSPIPIREVDIFMIKIVKIYKEVEILKGDWIMITKKQQDILDVTTTLWDERSNYNFRKLVFETLNRIEKKLKGDWIMEIKTGEEITNYILRRSGGVDVKGYKKELKKKWIPLEEHREFIEEVERRLNKYRKGKYIKLKEFLNQQKLLLCKKHNNLPETSNEVSGIKGDWKQWNMKNLEKNFLNKLD